MNKNRKLIALLAAATLIIGGIAVSFADEAVDSSNTTIVMTTDASLNASNFTAFRLLNVKTMQDSDGKNIYKYTINPKYRTILTQLTNKNTDSAIVAEISKLTGTEVEEFADKFYAQNVQEPDYETSYTQFENIPQGYYLLAETNVKDNNETISLTMIDTTAKETIAIKSKNNIPSVELKTVDTNYSTNEITNWQDSADYAVFEKVPFRFLVSLPSNYEEYRKYPLSFHGIEDKGLSFDEKSVVVKVNNVPVDDSTYHVEKDIDGESFVINIEDAKKIAKLPSDVITVEFESVLNNNLVYGKVGNKMTGYMSYPSNPESLILTKSNEDTATIFSYKLIINTVDGGGKETVGNGFMLFKLDAQTQEYKAFSDEIKHDNTSEFLFDGIDEGVYKLIATTVPDGYIKMADINFTITTDHDIQSAMPELNNIFINSESNFETNIEDGSIKLKFKNLTGKEASSPAQVGTTLFYIIGGILVLTGGLLFMTRKKTVDKE